MRQPMLVALALVLVATLSAARAAHAYDCAACGPKCEAMPFDFMKGACRATCKAMCSAANAVTGAANRVANAAKQLWERAKQTVVQIRGKAITLLNTAAQQAPQLWDQVKNFEMPLIVQWAAKRAGVDLRPKLTEYGIKIKDQFYGTCVAHAMSTGLEYALIPFLKADPALATKLLGRADPTGFRVSRKHLFWLSRHGVQLCSKDKVTDIGSWSLNMAYFVHHGGTVDEKYWPFTFWDPNSNKYPGCLEAETDARPARDTAWWSAVNTQRHFFIKQFYYLPGVALPIVASARRPEDLKGILDRGFPVLLAVNVYVGTWSAVNPPGLITMPPKDKVSEGGHEILVVGYDDAKRHFIFVNSWGESWGDKGFGYLPYDYVRDYARDALFIRSVGVQ
jgi:hypothetical protein